MSIRTCFGQGAGVSPVQMSGTSVPLGTVVAGVVDVPCPAIKATSLVFLTIATQRGTVGNIEVHTITPGTSFRISSDQAANTSTVNWVVVQPFAS